LYHAVLRVAVDRQRPVEDKEMRLEGIRQLVQDTPNFKSKRIAKVQEIRCWFGAGPGVGSSLSQVNFWRIGVVSISFLLLVMF
jgi:hypothetical protein